MSSPARPVRGSERALALLLVCALAAFALLAVSYDGRLGGFDERTAAWVAGELPAPLEWVARPFSWLGGWIGLTALGVAAAALLLRERAWLDLGFFAAAYLGSQLAVALLKGGFGRARPDAGSAVELPESAAFPSGHATAGAASLGALAVLLAERLPERRQRILVWACTLVLGLAVGLSRIALNVHFVTDVLAGWSLGLAWLAACLLARERLRARRGVTRAAPLPSARGRDDADPRPAPGGDRGPARLGP
ncbi:MAG TPA: phosphatase PAP2 family protein [Gaiellaceae bacterium]|nr:phosphatase PAP2 family protein [Gaiellaceae bacterium]